LKAYILNNFIPFASSDIRWLVMSTSREIEDLAKTNQKILSSDSSFPIVTLASGQKVPTGTVATLIHNIRLYDKIVARDGSEEEKEQLAKEIKSAVPVLGNVGFFDLFSTDEWTAGKSEGRRLVGIEGKRLGL
jgi:hypothetical protein